MSQPLHSVDDTPRDALGERTVLRVGVHGVEGQSCIQVGVRTSSMFHC